MKPVYLFFGQEQFLAEDEVQKLIARLLPDGKNAFNYQVYQASESQFRDVRTSVLTPAFGSGAKVVLVRHFDAWKSAEQEELLPLLEKWPPQTTLILWGEKVDKRTRLYQRLRKTGEVREFPRLASKELPVWLERRAGKYGLELTGDVAAALVRLMGDDLRLLDQELAKLATYLGADSRPTLADLEAVSWQADAVNIFTLVDAIGKRQQSTALKLLERMLTEGADPSGLLAMIARQMRIIFMIKALAGSGNMAQQLNLHPFVVKQCQQQAKGFQRQARERIFKALFAADLALKNSQEPKLVLEGLVTELCG